MGSCNSGGTLSSEAFSGGGGPSSVRDGSGGAGGGRTLDGHSMVLRSGATPAASSAGASDTMVINAADDGYTPGLRAACAAASASSAALPIPPPPSHPPPPLPRAPPVPPLAGDDRTMVFKDGTMVVKPAAASLLDRGGHAGLAGTSAGTGTMLLVSSGAKGADAGPPTFMRHMFGAALTPLDASKVRQESSGSRSARPSGAAPSLLPSQPIPGSRSVRVA
jgi:hypothetical protein